MLLRDYSLRRVAAHKGILLTTYGMVLHNSDALSLRQTQRRGDEDDDKPLWDFMILDEVILHAVLLQQRLKLT